MITWYDNITWDDHDIIPCYHLKLKSMLSPHVIIPYYHLMLFHVSVHISPHFIIPCCHPMLSPHAIIPGDNCSHYFKLGLIILPYLILGPDHYNYLLLSKALIIKDKRYSTVLAINAISDGSTLVRTVLTTGIQ
jgi:hypothetical protein